MSRYAIAFIVPQDDLKLCHQIIEADTKESALRKLFDEDLKEFYSDDDQGFYYFKEDFFDEQAPSGSIIEL